MCAGSRRGRGCGTGAGGRQGPRRPRPVRRARPAVSRFGATGRRGDGATGRRGDGATGRRGDGAFCGVVAGRGGAGDEAGEGESGSENGPGGGPEPGRREAGVRGTCASDTAHTAWPSSPGTARRSVPFEASWPPVRRTRRCAGPAPQRRLTVRATYPRLRLVRRARPAVSRYGAEAVPP
ncbi:hypothetical protein C0L86_06590 [Streptomyces sp. SCA2-2]|nr:hypothetical protein C0L86_06590 [Streptomyces sp. SCA2-2]